MRKRSLKARGAEQKAKLECGRVVARIDLFALELWDIDDVHEIEEHLKICMTCL